MYIKKTINAHTIFATRVKKDRREASTDFNVKLAPKIFANYQCSISAII